MLYKEFETAYVVLINKDEKFFELLKEQQTSINAINYLANRLHNTIDGFPNQANVSGNYCPELSVFIFAFFKLKFEEIKEIEDEIIENIFLDYESNPSDWDEIIINPKEKNFTFSKEKSKSKPKIKQYQWFKLNTISDVYQFKIKEGCLCKWNHSYYLMMDKEVIGPEEFLEKEDLTEKEYEIIMEDICQLYQ